MSGAFTIRPVAPLPCAWSAWAMALRRDSAPQLMTASRPLDWAAAQTRSARRRRSSDVSRGISLTIPVASPSTSWSRIQ